MDDQFVFSLVMATRGRTFEVARFFSSLREAVKATLPIQIIVADQNDDDRLSPVLETLPKAWRVEHVHTLARGVCAARNEVLSRIRAPFVAFPDDDCVYGDNVLEEVIRLFELHEECEVLLGVWKGLDEPFPASGREMIPRAVTRYSLFHHGEMFVQFYRTSVIRRVGDFDEAFGPGPASLYPFGGDDSDYLARAIRSGSRAIRCPSVHVHHPLQDMKGFARDKIAGYGRTRMALLRKLNYPWWFQVANVIYPLVRMFLSPARSRYFWAMFQGRFRGACKS